MIESGRARVLEFNVPLRRSGDESVLVPLLVLAEQIALFDLLDGAARGDLRAAIAKLDAAPPAAESARCVVLAADGYPAKPRGGDSIVGLDAALDPAAFVFHAGTAVAPDGAIVTAGGRVLSCRRGARPHARRRRRGSPTAPSLPFIGAASTTDADIGYRARSPLC